MKKICIFCGSSMGFDPVYKEKAAELGRVLADNGCELLYGGGSVGLMKVVADVMMERHCKVTGTITQHLLDMRVGHPDIDELIVVESMAERKKILEDMADGFIALPGGIGTMDEFFETVVLAKLGRFHGKTAVLNLDGFYEPLRDMLRHFVKTGMLTKEDYDRVVFAPTPQDLAKIF